MSIYDHRLNAFVQAAEQGNLSKTADTLFLSTTAVFKQLNSLEEELGIRLFDRSPKGLSLTPAGRCLYRNVKHIMEQCENAVSEAREIERSQKTTIRIGISAMTPAEFITRIWMEADEDAQNRFTPELIPFQNSVEENRYTLAHIGQNMDVIAAVYGLDYLNKNHCSALSFCDVPICVAVPKHHPLARKNSLQRSDLYGQHLLMIEKGVYPGMDQLRADLLRESPQTHIIDCPVYNIDTFNESVNSGYLIASTRLWEKVHPFLETISLSESYTIPFGLIYSESPDRKVSEFIAAFSSR